jgi:hypothetical protein
MLRPCFPPRTGVLLPRPPPGGSPRSADCATAAGGEEGTRSFRNNVFCPFCNTLFPFFDQADICAGGMAPIPPFAPRSQTDDCARFLLEGAWE